MFNSDVVLWYDWIILLLTYCYTFEGIVNE